MKRGFHYPKKAEIENYGQSTWASLPPNVKNLEFRSMTTPFITPSDIPTQYSVNEPS
ncbi:hypothetical protein JOC76_004201 [Neobacillus cucumis]|nr:hypothetical protein [Neobacillus cucumis]